MTVNKIQKMRYENRGFSLIELIMTIVIVGIVSIPLGLLLSRHYESIFISEDYHNAMNLARFEMERVRNMSYANIITASFSNYQGANYDVVRTVTFVQGTALTAESLKRVLVQVRKSGTLTIIFSSNTFIARNVSYGL